MLVKRAVSIALLRAGAAGLGAKRDCIAENRVVRTGSPRGERARHHADIGAVEIEADALPEFFGIVLAAAGIGAGDADLGTVEAFLDAANQVAANRTVSVRMRTDNR